MYRGVLRASRAWCNPRFRPSRSLLTLAHTHGPSSPSLLEQTIPSHFESIVKTHGSRLAVVSRHQGSRLTYEQLHCESNALAKALKKIGVKKGDRVAVSLGNNTEYAITTYALFKLGAILVPLNPAFTGEQVVAAMNHLAASHLIIGLETNLSRRPPTSNSLLISSLLGSSEKTALVPSLSSLIYVDNVKKDPTSPAERPILPNHPAIVSFAELLKSEDGSSDPEPDSPLRNSEVVNIQFTSGTTSTPKAAALAHRSILNNGHSIGARMLLTGSDVVVCPPPLFHCFGSILGYMATATHGSCIAFSAEAFDPLSTLLSVQEEGGTALYGVPTMFYAMLELIENGTVSREGFDNLRTGIAAGTNIPATLMSKLHDILNLTQLTICYGMTETSPVSCMTTTDDPIQMRLDSVGRLLPHVEAKVVSSTDRSQTLPVGEKGELVVNGYLVMAGYYGDKVRTDEALVEEGEGASKKRWMHTGDEAMMTPEGYVRITGRLKDLIIRGGENIHPLEIENCVLKHPDVFDVSVVGVKDERYGESVAAFVIGKAASLPDGATAATLALKAESIQQWVRERLSKHLIPKYVFFVDSFPKTSSGKVQKFVLREEAAKLVGTV